MEWDDKPVKFRDPRQGYISVPRIYVSELIDTRFMQRIKGISQTGIRPLYPSATHDRFSHSLGVYRFSTLAYSSLKKHILDDVENLKNRAAGIKECEKKAWKETLRWDLEFWEILIAIAALLHDIGHPAFSHAFEFLYDDILMAFPNTECPEDWQDFDAEYKELFHMHRIDMTKKENYLGWQKINDKWYQEFENVENGNVSYEKSRLKIILCGYFNDRLINPDNIKGNPHERMGAYMILSGMNREPEESKSHPYHAVKRVIDAYLGKAGNEQPPDYYGNKIGTAKDELIKDNIRFLCRMITGQTYATPYTSDFNFENYRKSAQNCVIRLLNGIVDVDTIDYTIRNAYSAGYDTHTVDYDRLCSSFSVYFEENILKSCFTANAISVLGGIISARNSEPSRLYSHHKVVYHDVLIKMLFSFTSKYLSYLDAADHYKNIQQSGVPRENVDVDVNANSAEVSDEPRNAHYYRAYGIYLISPLMPYLGSNITMNHSSDAALDTLFRNIDARLAISDGPMKGYQLYTEDDQKILKGLLKEYIKRKFKRSLWKSYAEYYAHIKEIAQQLGVNYSLIDRYMLDMIEKSLSKLFFNVIDPNGEKPTDKYVEQYIYFYERDTDEGLEPYERFRKPKEEPIDPKIVFGNINGKLSYPNCVCKIFQARLKKGYGDITIKLNDGKKLKLGEFLPDVNTGTALKFPYIYVAYCDKNEMDKLKKDFWDGFLTYCRERIKIESKKLCEENIRMNGFRDVVHGDIEFEDKFWNIVTTPEFQRLLRIKQLAMTSLVFPTANHTRFEHSIGAYHIMRQVVAHFRGVFNRLGINVDALSDDADIALLAALLHDIGHGPFSHAFECVFKKEEDIKNMHEEWTERIILESNDLNRAIRKNFGDTAPQKVVACLNNKDMAVSAKEINFSLIYSALISGALDVDRIDYLSRDGYYTAAKFGTIDIPKIISAMNLTSIKGEYHLCFDRNYLSYLDQLIFARKEMYNNVYFNTRKVLTETIMQKIIQRAYNIRDKLDEDDRKLLEKLQNPANMGVEEYIKLDDYKMHAIFNKWKDEKEDAILSGLIVSLSERNTFEPVMDTSSNGTEHAELINEINAKFGLNLGKKNDTPENFAFFMEEKHVPVYPDKIEKNNKSKTIIVLSQNGEIEDFGKITKIDPANITCHYLFWSKSLLKEVLIKNGHKEQEAQEKIENIIKLIEKYRPRNQIEIERKYYCDLNTWEVVKKCLDNNELSNKEDGSYTLCEPFVEKIQEDIYFDTDDTNGLLKRGKCTLRIRFFKKSYVCTVKLPTASESFGEKSPTARYEYETDDIPLDTTNDIDRNKLPNGQKEFIIKSLGSIGMTEEQFGSLIPILEVTNTRGKGIVQKVDSSFRCEVCLDKVSYKKPKETSIKQDWQIEIELKSDYETLILLDDFTAKLEKRMKENSCTFKPTEQSKLNRGIELLQ